MLLLTLPALAAPLLVERFDSTALPDGWSTKIGVQHGGGKPSTYTVEDGALVMTAGPKTRKFTAISRRLELRDLTWIQVGARVKTDGVVSPSSTAPCGVYVRFDGGEMTQAGPCSGADWTPFTRYFAVPAGAREVEVGFLLSAAGTARYDDLVVEPFKPDWSALGRDAFTYHWLGKDAFREDQLSANDDAYERALTILGAPSTAKIDYYRYGTLDLIDQFTGQRADAHVSGTVIHTLFRNDAVSIMRVLAQAWGNPPPLLSQGFAVAFAGEWDGREIKQASRALTTAGTAPTLETLLDPALFSNLPASTAYPVAGAFAQWILATKGQPTVQELFRQLKADAPLVENRKVLETALGMTLAEIDTALRAWW